MPVSRTVHAPAPRPSALRRASRIAAILALNVELEIDDRQRRRSPYGPERIPFSRRDEALRFLEMLGDGRVELVVQRNPVWTSLRSYRDGLALPFRKTSEPWLNLRFAPSACASASSDARERPRGPARE